MYDKKIILDWYDVFGKTITQVPLGTSGFNNKDKELRQMLAHSDIEGVLSALQEGGLIEDFFVALKKTTCKSDLSVRWITPGLELEVNLDEYSIEVALPGTEAYHLERLKKELE